MNEMVMRHWLRQWLGIEALETDFRESKSHAPYQDPARIAVLEAALVSQRDELTEQLQEIRERLEMPRRNKPSGRPFSVLAKLASMGAQAQREKEQVNG